MTEPRVTIRQATAAQGRELAGLRWEWAHGSAPAAGEPRWEQFASASTQWMRDHQETHIPFLAEHDGRAIGMAWLAWLPRVPDPTSFHRVGGDLQSVYVTPDHRGVGIGIRLVQAVIEHAASDAGHLTVRTGPSATSFYPQLGFAVNPTSLERPVP